MWSLFGDTDRYTNFSQEPTYFMFGLFTMSAMTVAALIAIIILYVEDDPAIGKPLHISPNHALAGYDCRQASLNDDHCGLLARGARASRRYARRARRWECRPRSLPHNH